MVYKENFQNSRRGILAAGAVALGGVAVGALPQILRADGSQFLFDTSKPPLSCADLFITTTDINGKQVSQQINKTYRRWRYVCFQGQDTSSVTSGSYDGSSNLMLQSIQDFWGYFLNINFPFDNLQLPSDQSKMIMMDHNFDYYSTVSEDVLNQEIITKLNIPSSYKTDGYNSYYAILIPDSFVMNPYPTFYIDSRSAPYYQMINGSNYYFGFSRLTGNLLPPMLSNDPNNQQGVYLTVNFEMSGQYDYPDGHTSDGVSYKRNL